MSGPNPERWRADSVAALAPYGFALPPHFPLLGEEDVGAHRPLEQVVARAQALVCMLNGAHGAPPEKVRSACSASMASQPLGQRDRAGVPGRPRRWARQRSC